MLKRQTVTKPCLKPLDQRTAHFKRTGLKPKTRVSLYRILYKAGISLCIITAIIGIFIGFAAGPVGIFLGAIAGGLLWLFPTMDFYEFYKKAEQELQEENRSYRFR